MAVINMINRSFSTLYVAVHIRLAEKLLWVINSLRLFGDRRQKYVMN